MDGDSGIMDGWVGTWMDDGCMDGWKEGLGGWMDKEILVEVIILEIWGDFKHYYVGIKLNL